jgi:hypothetical protein
MEKLLVSELLSGQNALINELCKYCVCSREEVPPDPPSGVVRLMPALGAGRVMSSGCATS